ncbi:MAG: septum site-determining protein MinC [Candidatus Obscuribacterales bacterium]
MTKIAIISQPDTGMLIDVGGCTNAQEAAQHLSSTFQDPTRFWESNQIDISLGNLCLSEDEAQEFAALITERGVRPRNVFSDDETTRAALAAAKVTARDTTSPAPANAAMDFAPPRRRNRFSETVISIAIPTSPTELSYATPISNEEVRPDEDTPTIPLPAVPALANEQAPPKPAAPAAPPQVLYLHQTLRSGQTVNHKGNLVIVGDVNNGAEVIAEGDILVWGALRGIAHAGSSGNEQAEIRALKLAPLQLRIAQCIARAPDRKNYKTSTPGPEMARIVDGQIRISYNAPE